MNRAAQRTQPTAGTGRRGRGSAVIATSVGVAVLVNLTIYLAGRAAGGSFTFAQQGQTMQVDAPTVAGFTVLPLAAGLVLMAFVGRRRPALFQVAMIGAPALAVATIAIMTLPAKFDAVSTLTLALCHLTLVPISVISLIALRRSTSARVGALDAQHGHTAQRRQTGPTTGVGS